MPVPDVIGRYRLGPRLGSGGFAVVWLAHDESLDTNIAIKVMADNWVDRMDLRERFLMEARMLRRAASNRIVQVFDIGELPDGRPYFVMEYADRGTLADRVRTEPLPLVVALRVTAEVARGAAELHRAGIVHRDLKPSNVLIRSAQGGPERLLIADLGVAKSLAQASGLTMSVGSAGYMAPEQSGPNSGVDVRADVYSLGAIAYRLITGEVPGLPGYVFAGGPRPDLPEPVRKLLQRTLEVNRERRWPEATTLAIQLDQLADQYAAEEQEPQPRRSGRRGRASIAAVAVLAALSGVGFGIFEWRQPVQVQAKNELISIDVPRSWNREVKPDGWEPAVLNLTKGVAPGLVVATDLDNWNLLNHDVNGVFVGASKDPDLIAAVTKIDHPDCTDKPSRPYTSTRWKGTISSWDGCKGANRSVQEISLTSQTGAATPQVYVQIRQDGGTDLTDQLLDSLRVQ
ncbi:MAG TPA: serine/threonine-protein kinase [Kineosporiaceae bacterium]|nr:serine/threonine-protein kinase [Kineosporiaceae bacterium]